MNPCNVFEDPSGILCQANTTRLAVFRQLDRAHDEDFADRRSPTFLFVHGILLRAENGISVFIKSRQGFANGLRPESTMARRSFWSRSQAVL